ncbi:MAG: hypothetical protein HC840_01400 [Leptolyngbyaceae cyanobacterium RM2_2_4]|nr:hypothetical protein [Leptolyngbyaceae cyanobacterium RM2_2_4]
MRATVGSRAAVSSIKPTAGSKTATTGIKRTSIPAASPPRNTSITPKRVAMRPSLGITNWVSQLIAIGFTLGALAIAAWIVWTLFLGNEFNPQEFLPSSNSSKESIGTLS